MNSAGEGGGGAGSNQKADDHNLGARGYHHRDPSNRGHQLHRQCFSGVALRITLLFVVVFIICLLLNHSAYPARFFRGDFYGRGNISSSSSSSSSPASCDTHAAMQHNAPPPAEGAKELKKTLRKAAMNDSKTVIITTLNAAWTEPNSIFDLFLESFRIGNGTQKLLKHIVVGALDEKAYSRCMAENLHCFAVTTHGVNFSGEAYFMSQDYLKMMWRRIDFLRIVLEMGYDFVFTDADVMWLRDPFPRFYPDGDFQIACDRYRFKYTDLNNSPNGGFNYVKSSSRTIQFYKFWHAAKDCFPGKHDQDVLNLIKFDPFINDIRLEMRFLDTAYFGGFCEPSKDLDLVITMHANCCVGMGNKIHDIKMVIDDWKRYISLHSVVGRSISRSWTVPRICG